MGPIRNPGRDDERDFPRAAGPTGRVGVVSVPCSQCGGPVALEDGASWVTCAHCRVPLALDVGRLLIHGLVRPVVRRQDLGAIVTAWLRESEVEGEVTVSSAALEFRPYYFAHPPGGRRVVIEAAPDPEASDVSIAQAAFEAGTIEPFTTDALGDAEAVAPVLVLDDVRGKIDAAMPRARGSVEAVRLVHLPLWRVRYRSDGIVHDAVVDAVTRRVSALSLPVRATSMLDTVAILWLVGGISASAILAYAAPVGVALAVYAVAGAVVWWLAGPGGGAAAERRP